jgi:hypothetical protein
MAAYLYLGISINNIILLVPEWICSVCNAIYHLPPAKNMSSMLSTCVVLHDRWQPPHLRHYSILPYEVSNVEKAIRVDEFMSPSRRRFPWPYGYPCVTVSSTTACMLDFRHFNCSSCGSLLWRSIAADIFSRLLTAVLSPASVTSKSLVLMYLYASSRQASPSTDARSDPPSR